MLIRMTALVSLSMGHPLVVAQRKPESSMAKVSGQIMVVLSWARIRLWDLRSPTVPEEGLQTEIRFWVISVRYKLSFSSMIRPSVWEALSGRGNKTKT